MLPVLSLLMVVVMSLLVTRIATVMLVHTGLALESARFQARSAYSGVGFTTRESEEIVAHPVRRRVVMSLMLIGNVGIVTGMSSLLLSFLDAGTGRQGWEPLAILAGGVLLVWGVASSQWVDQRLSRTISWALKRWTTVDARDYGKLLHLREDYGITELRLDADDWLAGRTLSQSRLASEGVLVLGVECPGNHFIGAPSADTQLRTGDRLILYGRTPRIAELDQRIQGGHGDQEHAEAIAEQRETLRAERAEAGR